ncbi:hypothetical protein B0H12DRAFT_178958 [Mycena haematopus]|nr:hypothetical protein B0H12DRAFT_178958 [Mycena haematopus]
MDWATPPPAVPLPFLDWVACHRCHCEELCQRAPARRRGCSLADSISSGSSNLDCRATDSSMLDGKARGTLCMADSQVTLRGILCTSPHSSQFRVIRYDMYTYLMPSYWPLGPSTHRVNRQGARQCCCQGGHIQLRLAYLDLASSTFKLSPS